MSSEGQKHNPSKNNSHPIVFVHGWSGWGQEEIPGCHYFGGEHDLITALKAQGYDVYAAKVGPFSSNWDRAAELYAQIKGGVVDYGGAHSGAAGHLAISDEKSYPGFYPEWGERNPDGSINKVHLVGHSLGGLTARLLCQFLENGNAHEVSYAALRNLPISPLYSNTPETKDWVSSVTTIGTPHNGNTVVYAIEDSFPGLIRYFQVIAEKGEFDLMLGHWGIEREAGESFIEYLVRINAMYDVKESWDNPLLDITFEGIREFNRWVKTQQNIYYFSYAMNATCPGEQGYEIPLPCMSDLLVEGAETIGRMEGEYGEVQVDESWWPNDGMLSAKSQVGPSLGSQDHILRYDPTVGPQTGVWNHLGTLRETDHFAVNGFMTNDMTEWPFERVLSFYSEHLSMLLSLKS
jgi:triacylglycerol lipase